MLVRTARNFGYNNSPSGNSGGSGLKTKFFLVGGGVAAIVLLITLFMSVGFTTIEGTERVVVQDWNDGVQSEVLSSGTHFYIPLTTTHYKYNIGTEKFIMGHKELYNGKGSEYVDYPAFTITTGGKGKEQPATFSVTLQYHLDSAKLVDLHNQSGANYEDLVIKPALTRIISDQATKLQVLDFYSGNGRVDLQNSIEKAITDHPELAKVGIVVETFVFDQIKLDQDFVNEITGRQLATQKKLREKEEALAAVETAKKVKAQAQADKEKRIVNAEALKAEKVKAAEAQNESRILAAKAEAEEIKQKAAAERYRKEQDAKGLLAQGLAQAKVDKERKMSRYAGEAGARQAAVEIARYDVDRFKNFNPQGVITEKTFLNVNSGSKSPIVTIDGDK